MEMEESSQESNDGNQFMPQSKDELEKARTCFFVVAYIPIAWDLIVWTLWIDESMQSLVSSVLQVASAAFICSKLSFELVGLKWRINSMKHFPWFGVENVIRPMPYSPTTYSSNLFWISMLLRTSFFVYGFLYHLVHYLLGSAMLRLISCSVEICSFVFYYSAHKKAQTEAEEVTRSLLLEADADFPNIDDSDESSSKIVV